jgi:hypothetical protein
MSQLVLKCQARHVEGEAKIHLETQRVSITCQSQQQCLLAKAQNQNHMAQIPQHCMVSIHRLGCAIKQNLVVCLAQQICSVLAACEQQVQCTAGSGHSYWSY